MTEKQKIVGKNSLLGSHGYISESYDANLHTRQIDTSVPDGPAYDRKMARENDLQKQMETKRREEVREREREREQNQPKN